MCGGDQRPRYGNRPQTAPDIEEQGRAWHIPGSESAEGGIDAWLVHLPHGHPLFTWYVVSISHLRDCEPIQIKRPNATHEILVTALNPEFPLPDLDCWTMAHYMWPHELVYQFTVRSDEQAQMLTAALVKHACSGNPLDEDYAPYWRQVVDDTAEHLMYDGHPAWN